MPSDVYQRTHEGLAAMVSLRAASRVLDDALRDGGHTPEGVSAEQMSDLLLGPILRELEGILPREGLKRNLRELVVGLRTLQQSQRNPETSPEPAFAPAGRTPFAVEEDAPAPPLEPAPPTPALAAVAVEVEETLDVPPSAVDVRSVELRAATRSSAVAAHVAPTPAGGEAAPAEETAAPLSEASLERAALTFARLDHVRLVAAVRADGRIAVSRGGGLDLEALSRLGRLGLHLLGRSGRLRSYYLAHTQGQLFLFPLGSDTLVVVGSPDLNLGAVFSTLGALKEEL